jgi:hypothetical protein
MVQHPFFWYYTKIGGYDCTGGKTNPTSRMRDREMIGGGEDPKLF